MSALDQQDEDGCQDRVDGVFVVHLSRIMVVMSEHYPKVLAANRFFEEETGIHNELGNNNLTDALSHLGTLFERAEEMDFDRQGHEVHDFEGHLRRGMMESYEQVFRMRMGKVDELWEKHEAKARGLLQEGKLGGAPGPEDLDTLRRRCKNLLDEGRKAKRGHDWDAWDRGTEALADACLTASKLHDGLRQGISLADDEGTGTRRYRAAIAIGLITSIVCLPLGALVGSWLQHEETRVPDVVSLPAPEAVLSLSNSSLRSDLRPRSGNRARCSVVAQTPPPRRSVDTNSTVTLRVRC